MPCLRPLVAKALRSVRCVLGLALLIGGCKDEPSHPELDPVRLRIVPETSVVSPRGDTVFALLEIAQPEASPGSLTLRFHAENGIPVPLPGPASCAGGDDAGADRPDAAADSDDLTFPPAIQRLNSARRVREVGLMIRVPAGADDVLLTASAYSANSPFDCATPQGELKALAFVRIARIRPVAPADADTGSSDESEPEVGSDPDAGSDSNGGSQTSDADAADGPTD